MSRDPPFAITGIFNRSATFRMASTKINRKFYETNNSTNFQRSFPDLYTCLCCLHVVAVRVFFGHAQQLH